MEHKSCDGCVHWLRREHVSLPERFTIGKTWGCCNRAQTVMNLPVHPNTTLLATTDRGTAGSYLLTQAEHYCSDFQSVNAPRLAELEADFERTQ